MIVVSTLSEENYNNYANKTIPTWLKFFPEDTKFIIHCDFDLLLEDERVIYVSSSDQKIEFIERNKNIVRDVVPMKGYTARWDTYCHKVFAQCETALTLDNEIMIFIDADVALLKNVDLEIISNFLKDSFCSYVGRTNEGTETGLIFYNLELDKDKNFFKNFIDIYLTDEIFNFPQWDDCYVFDKLRSQTDLNFISMSGGYEFFIDPISVGPLGEYFDHWLGKLSKLRGYSKHRKFRGKI
jgi:hypothetical protein